MSVSFLGSQAAESGVVALSLPRLVTTSVSAHTKGVYSTEHIAATAYPAAWILVQIAAPASADDFLVDVAVGAASSEQVIIANLPISSNSTASNPAANYLLPVFIPSGSRMSACCQAAIGGGTTVRVQMTLFAPMFGGERGLGQVETCGANTGTSLGTTIPAHTTTINTKGTWTPLTTSTSFAYKWVCLGITHTNALGGPTGWTLDIGVGAGGSEVVVVPDIVLGASSVADALSSGGRSFPLSIPAGSRVSARVQATTATAAERDIELVLLGVG